MAISDDITIRLWSQTCVLLLTHAPQFQYCLSWFCPKKAVKSVAGIELFSAVLWVLLYLYSFTKLNITVMAHLFTSILSEFVWSSNLGHICVQSMERVFYRVQHCIQSIINLQPNAQNQKKNIFTKFGCYRNKTQPCSNMSVCIYKPPIIKSQNFLDIQYHFTIYHSCLFLAIYFVFALDLFMLWFIFPVFHENRRLFSGYFVHFCIVFQHTTKHVAVLDCKEIIENKTSRLNSLTLSFVEIYMLISIDALPEGLC